VAAVTTLVGTVVVKDVVVDATAAIVVVPVVLVIVLVDWKMSLESSPHTVDLLTESTLAIL